MTLEQEWHIPDVLMADREGDVFGYAIFDKKTGHWRPGQYNIDTHPLEVMAEILDAIAGAE